jgi:hypothetical protein
MFNIFSSRSKDESTKNQEVVTEQIEIENEFNHAARIINERIALAENRIRDEINSLLKDLSPSDFDIEVKSLCKNTPFYKVIESIVKIKISL